MTTQIDRIMAEARANLERGRAIATGIGRFILVIEDGDPLLRRRLEKDSLHGQDLSGKWEIPGGGVELQHFQDVAAEEPDVSRYQRPILQTLVQELMEEAYLRIVGIFPIVEIPAFVSRQYERDDEPRETIDDAAVIPVSFSVCEETQEFRDLIARGDLMFVPRDKLGEIEFVSPRMRFLVEQALIVWDLINR